MQACLTVGTYRFHQDANFNYQLNRWTAFGGLPPELIGETARKIATLEDWNREFLRLAGEAERAGNVRHAAFYYRAVDFFLPYHHPRKIEMYGKTVALLREYHRRAFSDGRIQEYSVPYQGERLPAWKAPACGAILGTIVLTGGFDCIKEELIPVLLIFADMGYDVYLFEGPGQGETLHKEGLTMTPAWEKPVAAVLDYFALDNVTLIGLSLGGYLASAAAYDGRIQRVICWGIMADFYKVVVSKRGRLLEAFINLSLALRLSLPLNAAVRMKMRRDAYSFWGVDHGMRVLGAHSPYGYFRKLKDYSLKHIAACIKQDVYLAAGSEDHFVPLDHLYKLMDGLKSAKSITARIFTVAESAENHCQFGNIRLVLQSFADWIKAMSLSGL